MNNAATFTAQLAEATEKLEAARAALAAAKTARARRDAGEDIEFWMSKKAFCGAAIR